MNTRKIIGTILIIGSLVLGYTAVNKISSNAASVKVLGLEIDVSNESGKEQGYIYLGLAILLFGGGIYTMKNN